MFVENQLFAGRYRLLEELGRGSFGEVWRVLDEQLDLQVALKIYIALDDRGIEDFKKEYKVAYSLNHPNLLHAYHFDICDSRPYLVMPYCPASATSLIGNCSGDVLERFIRDVAAGLSYLHSQDIVHHDIKPDNILITEEGRFVITDFGISTRMRSTLRRNSTRTMNQKSSGGSLPYMGPEMFSSKPESVKATDIWAFGATLYEMITGELPFFGQGGAMLMKGAAVPDLDCGDRNISALVKDCLAKETWDRPTAEQMLARMEHKENPSSAKKEQSLKDTVKKSAENKAEEPVEEKKGDQTPERRRKYAWLFLVPFLFLFVAGPLLYINNSHIYLNGPEYVSAKGGTVEYSVSTNRPFYSVRGVPPWAEMVSKSSKGFSIRYDSSPDGTRREAVLKVSAFGYSRQLTVVQRPLATYLKISKINVNFDSSGGSATLKVNTDGDSFELEGLPYWCSLVSREGKTFKLKCDGNSSSNSRSASFKVKADSHSVTVKLLQDGKEATYLKVNGQTAVSSTFNSGAGTCSYSVDTDGENFEVRGLPSWCKVTEKTSSSFKISYDENKGAGRNNWFDVISDNKRVRINLTQKGPGPSAKIESLNVDHNVTQGGQKGMLIHVKFSTSKMKGRQGYVAVYFHRKDGTPLKDENSNYCTTTGYVACSDTFTPTYEESLYEDFQIFMPYSELHVSDPGETECYFVVFIWDGDDPLFRYDEYYFSINN